MFGYSTKEMLVITRLFFDYYFTKKKRTNLTKNELAKADKKR